MHKAPLKLLTQGVCQNIATNALIISITLISLYIETISTYNCTFFEKQWDKDSKQTKKLTDVTGIISK